MRTVIAAALLIVAGITVARADTTYTYVGGPWGYSSDTSSTVAASPAVFGTNMVGLVTFNFDTTGFTGSVEGLNTVPLNVQPEIVDIQLTSGTVTADWKALGIHQAEFDFTNGQITDWSVVSAAVSCNETYSCIMETMMGSNTANDVVGFCSCAHVSVFGTVGTWSVVTPDPSAVPAPPIGAGLSGVIMAGFFGWGQLRRRRRNSLAYFPSRAVAEHGNGV